VHACRNQLSEQLILPQDFGLSGERQTLTPGASLESEA